MSHEPTQPRSSTSVMVDEPERPRIQLPDDWSRALTLQQRLRALARRDPRYADVLGGRPSVRLAYFVVTGHVQELTELGRRRFDDDLDLLLRAAEVEPGLDPNRFIDRLTGRPDPRQEAAEQSGPPRRVRTS
jgi:hypothetical protein